MNIDNEDIVENQNVKEDSKSVTRNKASRERLKMIAKYIDIFEVIFIARYIDYKMISKLAFVSHRTVERAFKEIRKDKYAKDLIIEVRDGNSIVVYASNSLMRLMGSDIRCPLSRKDTDKEVYISQNKKNEALMRVLKYVYPNVNINSEISNALIAADFTELENRIIKEELKHCSEFLEKAYPYQNYMVYVYRFNLLEFNDQINWGDIKFDRDSGLISADVFCFSYEINDIIRTYDKALLLLEALKYINYKDCKDYKIEINYIVITLERVDISEYIHKLNNSYRYYTLDFFDNYYYRLNLGNTRGRKWFFRIYKDTVIDETKFILFSNVTGNTIEYGTNPKKIRLSL